MHPLQISLLVLSLAANTQAAKVKDPEEVLDLFEGDIELPKPGRTPFRNAISDEQKLWPNGQVPYEINDPNNVISDAQKANLTTAIRNFAKNTCIRFYENRDSELKTLLLIQKSNGGCSSNVGMMDGSKLSKGRGQIVRLSDECFEVGKITHELMHSLGFFHEQSRHDRDEYVKFIPQNIEQGKIRQFRRYDISKHNKDITQAPYDYGSLMHYPEWAFSKDETLKTIVTVHEAEIGQRRAMSKIDIWKINKLYNCPNVGPVPKVTRIPKAVSAKDKHPFPVERSFSCNFDYFYSCDMRDEMQSDFDWEIGKGVTSKYFKTGPKKSVNGDDCCYLYTSSIVKKVGDKATVVTPVMQPTMAEGSCLSFHYYMFGETVGSLEVFWRPLGTKEENVILKEIGEKGERWIKKHVVLNIDTEFEVVFRATVGGSEDSTYEGNIAIDDIDIKPVIRLRATGKKCGD